MVTSIEDALELVERTIPEALLPLDPRARFLQRLLPQPEEVHPPLDSALNQFRVFEHFEVPGDRGLGRIELLAQVPRAARLAPSQRMLVGGVYRQIEVPSRLVFSWLIDPPDIHAGIESQVTVSIAASAEGSDLLILHERFDRADANARHSAGWAGALERLQRLLAKAGPS